MALFDPDTGKVLDPEALRSVRLAGEMRSERVRVTDDGLRITETIHHDTGKTAGFTTEHPSGRVDVDVFAGPATTTTIPGKG
jgi:hypothetical protein